MKLKNTTGYDDLFLRRMVVWISKEIDLPVRAAKDATFKNARNRSSGHAWPWVGKFIVRIRKMEIADIFEYTRHGVTRRFVDRMEVLIAITAHELAHLRQCVERGRLYSQHGSVEPEACRAEVYALDQFRKRRDELLAEWSQPVTRTVKPQVSAAEKREMSIRKKLSEWESKLQRAKNRVAHYKVKARYYDRKAATREEKRTDNDSDESLPRM